MSWPMHCPYHTRKSSDCEKSPLRLVNCMVALALWATLFSGVERIAVAVIELCGWLLWELHLFICCFCLDRQNLSL